MMPSENEQKYAYLAGGGVQFASCQEDGAVRVDEGPHGGVADAVAALLLHGAQCHARQLVRRGHLDRRPPVLVLHVREGA